MAWSGQSKIDRRTFLAHGLRLGVLGAMAACAGTLVGRGQVRPARAACPGARPCRDCVRLATCDEPRALRARRKSGSEE